MIVIIAGIETTAADIERVKDAIGAMENASREEDGCEDYRFCVEVNDPNRLRITECWRDVEALQAHFATPHMAEFNQAIAGMTRNVEVRCFEATEIPFPINLG